MRSRLLSLGILFALGAPLACCTSVAPLEPDVRLLWDGDAAVLSISNPHDRTIGIVDLNYERDGDGSWPTSLPGGVYIRIADDSGAIVTNSVRDPEGWFSPLMLISSLGTPPRRFPLRPAATVVSHVTPAEMVVGMDYDYLPDSGNCRFQFKAEVYSSSSRWALTQPGVFTRDSVSQTTEWLSRPCAELFEHLGR
jgi:hypothetical protein